MGSRGHAGRVAVVVFSTAVCLAGLGWTVFALGRVELGQSDPAGVLSFGLGVVGAVLGGWGLWAAVHGVRAQRTGEVVAEQLARAVVRKEGTQYRQLLGSGRAAPGGRIDLVFSTTATAVTGARSGGTLADITGFYRELRPGRLVITGTPRPDGDGAGDEGTGKTVLALALLLGLARERGAGEPVPVLLTAASWPGGELRQWLRAHLASAYHLSPRDAGLVVAAELVLPVIDGLDETDRDTAPGYGSRAAALLRAVERFESGGVRCPVVLTCRHAQYRALVDADAQPRVAAHIALERVDPARARAYLERRVAATERGRTRWQPVLDALEQAADPAGPAPDAARRLARALDTPWRLTLAVVVFQERTPDGGHLRDPAGLPALAAGGRLYEYLLDRCVGAAVTAPHHGTGITAPGAADGAEPVRRGHRPPRLDAGVTWRRLAVLARHLNDGAGTAARPPRVVAGRVPSGTDLVLHELWPLAGPRRALWTDRALSVALAVPVSAGLVWRIGLPLWQRAALALLFVPAVALVGSRPWPRPHRLEPGRLRTRAGRRGFALRLAAGLAAGLVFVLLFGPVVGVTAGLAVGAVGALAAGVTAGEERPVTDPRDLVRGDLITCLAYGAGFGLGLGLAVGIGYGPVAGLTEGLVSGAAVGIAVGLMSGAGRAAVRYLAFLLCVRGRLPWRLGRFLDACYRLGLLRVAGTAWQFRHRELQDHLAARPDPPSRP
ncbi:hypothetical protein V1L54_02215 [Streptomyces sp. TRM 70361]|uniref:hypothetical protein n=1 Tax=Streptomyces sp. TRM 70361 TaxID=3116553 RepID=UPI002E7BDE84|nr:hypothetical protein [Streptomyces sp. TRM 70361]MEE1938243.1 hypothetical protein [Streptomyces sp. TRM 70361]